MDRTSGEGAAGRGGSGGKLGRLLGALPAALRSELNALWQRQTVATGTVLLADGRSSDTVGYVVSGILGMTKELPDGRKHIIGLLVPTDMFGRPYDTAVGYSVEALTEAEVVTCPSGAFEALLSKAPEAEHLFLVNVLDELDAAREWVLILSRPKVVQRVASFLLILARRKQREEEEDEEAEPEAGVNLQVAVRRAELAQYLGARPESLSRAFHELERDGVIRINGPYDFDLLDIEALIEIAGHDLAAEEEPALRAREP